MRLRYAQPRKPGDLPNFGDLLNPLIFESFLPGYFDATYADVDLLGIGTTLGMAFPSGGPERQTIVFSSGLGGSSDRGAYGRPPVLTDKFDIICVRGPLTANALGISPQTVVTDGALLLQAMDIPAPMASAPEHPVFIPHMSSTGAGGRWDEVGAEIGIRALDPCTENVIGMINEIRRAPLVLAEAMHAAIVADTFGVPWIPIVTNSTINRFKWEDWCRSLGLVYNPVRLPPLLGRQASFTAVKAKLPTATPAVVTKGAHRAYDFVVEPQSFRLAVSRLRRAARTAPQLSSPYVRHAKLDELQERLESVRRRYPL